MITNIKGKKPWKDSSYQKVTGHVWSEKVTRSLRDFKVIYYYGVIVWALSFHIDTSL